MSPALQILEDRQNLVGWRLVLNYMQTPPTHYSFKSSERWPTWKVTHTRLPICLALNVLWEVGTQSNIDIFTQPNSWWWTTLRATFHYSGEVHQSVKIFSPRHGYLRQGMVCQRRWKDNKIFDSSLEFSRGQVSCMRFEGCPRNLTSEELPRGVHCILCLRITCVHDPS